MSNQRTTLARIFHTLLATETTPCAKSFSAFAAARDIRAKTTPTSRGCFSPHDRQSPGPTRAESRRAPPKFHDECEICGLDALPQATRAQPRPLGAPSGHSRTAQRSVPTLVQNGSKAGGESDCPRNTRNTRKGYCFTGNTAEPNPRLGFFDHECHGCDPDKAARLSIEDEDILGGPASLRAGARRDASPPPYSGSSLLAVGCPQTQRCSLGNH